LNTVNIIKNEAKKFPLFFIGLSLIALGSVHMIKVSGLGVQPFDTFYIGLSEHLHITIGTSSIIFGIILLTISMFLTKEKLKIGTILDTIFLGMFVDFFLHIDLVNTPDSLVWRYVFMLFGIILISIGSALTIFSNLGAGPIDTFMLSIRKTCNLSVKLSTTLIEGFALAAGFLLGGPIGFGTLLFLFSIGPLIEFSLHVLSKFETVQVPPIEEKVS
jgi:uncharacterized membrane protein YczE